MKNLKIKFKLLLGTLGQLLLIVLLLLFMFSFNNKLKHITQERTRNIQESNMFRQVAVLVKDYLNNKITFEQLEKDYAEIEAIANNTSYHSEIKSFWAELVKVKQLKEDNISINKRIENLINESLGQSNSFIENISLRLADVNTRGNVSTIERVVIQGANLANNNLFNIHTLFLKIEKDIAYKNELIQFLNEAINQAEIDKERLKNTQFAALPDNAIQANVKIKDLTLQFVENIEKYDKISDEILKLSNELIIQLDTDNVNSTEESFSSLKAIFRNIFMILLLISLLVVILNISISKLIGYVLSQLSIDLTEMSNGNLNIARTKEYRNRKDEIGILAISFDKLILNLKNIVNNIISGANNVASASQQISSATQRLSQGASEQASSTEEVSSSMEEMSSNIQQNADNAKQTEKIALGAVEGITRVAGAAQESLSSIKQIAEKITIVNDIAFQTNILALNAAVEAARAGEHGKGFAVVAAEVRKLAERSKIAADEINELSGKSLKVTEDAGGLMGEIIPEIERTAKLVQEISAASLEQNTGSDQINSAIQQLSEVTQQNAAASEEMATSSEELASQADQLRHVVSFFKVDGIDNNFEVNKNKLQQFSSEIDKIKQKSGSGRGSNNKELENNGFDLKLTDSDKLDGEFESF